MRSQLLVLLCCVSACGKTQTSGDEPFLSAEDIEKHNIPQPASGCPLDAAVWPHRATVELPDRMELFETSVESTVDSCGNLVVAWADIMETWVVRVFPDGALDWAQSFPRTGEPWHVAVRGVATDAIGSIFVATSESIVPLAATGIRHPHAEEDLAIRTMFIERRESYYVVGLPGYAVVRLPEGNVIWQSSYFNVVPASTGDTTVGGEPLQDDDGLVRFKLTRSLTDPPASTLIAERELPGGEFELLQHNAPSFEHEFEGEVASFASGSREGDVAVSYSVSLTGQDEDTCESWIRWESRGVEQLIDLCGLAQDVAFGPDGSLYALWMIPGESETGLLRLMKWSKDDSIPTDIELPDLVEVPLPRGNSWLVPTFPSLASLAFGAKDELIISAPSADWEALELLVVDNL